MLLIKMWYHFFSYVQMIMIKIIYGSKIKIGNGTTWRRGFSIMKNPYAKVIIGKNCFFNNYCSINANHLIEIGNDTILGENVKIYDHNHRFNQHKVIKQQGFSNGSVIIGKGCWIGSNVTILKGTEIGDNCVIGAGCVLNGKIQNDCVVKMEHKMIIEKILYKDDKENV